MVAATVRSILFIFKNNKPFLEPSCLVVIWGVDEVVKRGEAALA